MTDVALEGLVARVGSLVTVHVRHGLERLSAELTLVATDASVILFVRPELLQLAKLFPADSAEPREGRGITQCVIFHPS